MTNYNDPFLALFQKRDGVPHATEAAWDMARNLPLEFNTAQQSIADNRELSNAGKAAAMTKLVDQTRQRLADAQRALQDTMRHTWESMARADSIATTAPKDPADIARLETVTRHLLTLTDVQLGEVVMRAAASNDTLSLLALATLPRALSPSETMINWRDHAIAPLRETRIPGQYAKLEEEREHQEYARAMIDTAAMFIAAAAGPTHPPTVEPSPVALFTP